MRVLLYFRIRAVLAGNAMFLSLSYSFRYRIITLQLRSQILNQLFVRKVSGMNQEYV